MCSRRTANRGDYTRVDSGLGRYIWRNISDSAEHTDSHSQSQRPEGPIRDFLASVISAVTCVSVLHRIDTWQIVH